AGCRSRRPGSRLDLTAHRRRGSRPGQFMRTALAKLTVPAVLYAALGVLVVIPIVMIVVASFLTAPPFSGAGPLGFTTANYAQLWNSDIGMAAFNTLTIGLGGSAIALLIGCSLAWLAARTD